jgi:hypothetical protein
MRAVFYSRSAIGGRATSALVCGGQDCDYQTGGRPGFLATRQPLLGGATTKLAAAMLSQGIDIGRPHPTHANWARIWVGLPEENQRALDGLRRTLGELPRTTPVPQNEPRSNLLH